MAATRRGGSQRSAAEKFADLTTPDTTNANISDHSVWWWAFVLPGKAILWVQYMFPESFSGIFGSARRRDIPLIQILYSLIFYTIVAILIMCLWI